MLVQVHVRKLFLFTLFALFAVFFGCNRASAPTKVGGAFSEARGAISEAGWSMAVEPSSSIVDSASGTCLEVVLKERPHDNFDIDIAIARKSGLIPEAGSPEARSFDTRSLSGWEVELTFDPQSKANSLEGNAFYTVNSLKIVSRAGGH
jgi:hypothetical protein